MSIRWSEAVGMMAKLWIAVLVLMSLKILRKSEEPADWDRMVIGGSAAVACFVLFTVLLRGAYRVTVSSLGVAGGWSAPVAWGEIHDVEHQKMPFGGPGYALRSQYRSTVVVLDSIARSEEFRAALNAHAPPAHVARRMLDDSR